MTVALVGAFATIAALIGAAMWIVSVVRADGRERAAALVQAERFERRLDYAEHFAEMEQERLAGEIRRATRRADALEEWARGRIGVAVDDGTDLLLAELSVIAAGVDDDTAPADDSARATTSVLDRRAEPATATAGARDVGLDETLPGEGAR